MTTFCYGHIPVLFEEILDKIVIDSHKQNIVVDATLGLGGHAIGIIDKLNPGDIFIGFDSDVDNLTEAQSNIDKILGDKIRNKNIMIFFINSNFKFLKEKIFGIGIDKITHIYYDFGVNSVHYDNPEKGFSYRALGPLDLRYDRTGGITAQDIVNDYSSKDLSDILYRYGEEKKTPFIINEIIKSRAIKRITTTFDLAEIIDRSSYDPKSKVRVFQALRIEVNDEFGCIRKSLGEAIDLLDKDGILACITFHSLEDRIVKEMFGNFTENIINDFTGHIKSFGKARKVTKKPISPSEKEVMENPRSRSAKLRVIQKN